MLLRGRIRLLIPHGRVRPKVRVEGALDSNDHATGCRHTLDMLLRDEYSEKVTQKTDVVAAGAGAEEDRPTLLLRLKRKNPPHSATLISSKTTGTGVVVEVEEEGI